jgi:hypothetical protein
MTVVKSVKFTDNATRAGNQEKALEPFFFASSDCSSTPYDGS